LKNLRLRKESRRETISINEILESIENRYNSLENVLPLNLSKDIESDSVRSEATLLEELIFILLRIFHNLHTKETDRLSVCITGKPNENGQVLLALDAGTRRIRSEELPYILEPLQGGKRKKIQDTNLLTVCAQKIIKHLAINAWCESKESGLCIHISLPAGN
jgi:hypothetical protein